MEYTEEQTRRSLVGSCCPDFDVEVMANGEFGRARLEDFKDKYLLLLFYPLDFTFVCPTELLAFSAKLEEFRALNTEVLGVSVDSKYSHLAWWNTSQREGGLGGSPLPLASDVRRTMTKDFGVLSSEGVAYRGLFLIDQKGVVRHASINDLPIGRNVDEALRVVQALQFHEENGDVCPAGWRPGDDAMTPEPKAAKGYFAKNYAQPQGDAAS